jgi:hypothetical protein
MMANEHITVGSNSYEKVKTFKYVYSPDFTEVHVTMGSQKKERERERKKNRNPQSIKNKQL